jgi:SAM-dependent methyltransferase
MQRVSLLRSGSYSADWANDFYAQATEWWGPDPQPPGVHKERVAIVERLCGPAPKKILDLGAGAGYTAAAMADRGHTVVAVEATAARAQRVQELAKVARKGSLTAIEADFHTAALTQRFDVVCLWEVFGLGSDADQRRLLRRIAQEWLVHDGCALLDVYCPFRPARDAGTAVRREPLEGVPGSVEMLERCHFDPVHCRWIDEWEPSAAPERALAQAVRCYTPADLLLLLEGTGLALERIEVDGQVVDVHADTLVKSGPLMEAWIYLAQLVAQKG